MRMSAICRRSNASFLPGSLEESGQETRGANTSRRREPAAVPARRPQSVSGFTLVEILIVLVIAGLLSSMALPRLQRMVQSIEISGQRENVVNELEGLGYRAFATGKSLSLTTSPAVDAPASKEQAVQLPSGWKLSVPQPINYAYNGICSGGKIMVIAPDNNREIFQLKPPLCRLEPVSESADVWN